MLNWLGEGIASHKASSVNLPMDSSQSWSVFGYLGTTRVMKYIILTFY